MKEPNLKIGQKVFKINVFNFEIECTNFLEFDRDDFVNFSTAILSALVFLWFFMHVPLTWLLLYCYPKTAWVIVIVNYIWIILDRNTPSLLGRKCRQKWFRDNRLLTHLKNYFSSKLIKTSDLPPGRNYLLAAFPHSVIPVNTLINFLSNANKIDEIFTGIDMHYVTHDWAFFVPLVREYFLWIGGRACNESSLKRLLNTPPSKGIIVYPGGTTEIPLTAPGSVYKINKSGRKGFIRMALSTGTPLVPVFNFGEINIFGTWVYPIKRKLKFLHAPDLFFPKGRGIFQTHFGWLPIQHPVTSVVGAPIEVPKIENPSPETIDEYHEKFFEALYELFEEHKHTCDVAGAKAKLIML